MVKSKIQDAGLRMKLQHDANPMWSWMRAQLKRYGAPISLKMFRTPQIRLSNLLSGRADFAGSKRHAAPVSRHPLS